MIQVIRRPISLKGEISPPADKSISHRSLLLNSIAEGQAQVSNFLTSADCLSTLSCLRDLGVEIALEGTDVTITGNGKNEFTQPTGVLDAGNSGTTMRLLSGLLATQPFTSTITGDESLRSRPMGRVINPLIQMGAKIEGREDNSKAPLTISGGNLHGIDYDMPVASAQVKSSILLAALSTKGDTVIRQPASSRDHTERMLSAMGASIGVSGLTLTLSPVDSPLKALSLRVPADISSAAFWLVAGAIHPDARISVKGVGTNPTRDGIVEVLQSMGANLIIENQRFEGEEPVADLVIESSSLKSTIIEGKMIPRLIDEIPVIAVAASVAEGTTIIRDAAELRVKESDRISTTASELSMLGAQIEGFHVGMAIHGVSRLTGNQCDSHGDHRLAMALGIAGLIADGETTISNAEAVDISYPGFWEDQARLSG